MLETITKEKVSSDTILEWVIKCVEGKKEIDRNLWLEIAFRLNVLRIQEAILYNKMHQSVRIKEFEIYKAQTKKNKSAAQLEVETLNEFRFMKDQEDKIYSIDQFVMIAKKNTDINL
mgnify:CR=1 FL=1